MFGFLQYFLDKRRSRRAESKFAYRFSSADSSYIENVLNVLPTMGLHPTFPPEKIKEKSEQIAKAHEGVFCIRQPSAVSWVVFAVSGEERAFTNAMRLGDHCYDGSLQSSWPP